MNATSPASLSRFAPAISSSFGVAAVAALAVASALASVAAHAAPGAPASTERSASSGASFSIGLEGHGRTRIEDIGLPAYPGAVLAREKGEGRADGKGDQDSEPAVTLGAWAGRFGLRLNVMKFHSDAPPSRVADFYAKAMAAQGVLVDCADPAMRQKPKAGEADRPTCSEGELKPGHFEYRIGTARHFRMVHIQPRGQGSQLDMVRMQLGS